ncbi:uncharacterized protein BDZ99DRAFT_577333, partial [Mytilinidion resinicola]
MESFHPVHIPVWLCETQTDKNSDLIKRHASDLRDSNRKCLATRYHRKMIPDRELDYREMTTGLIAITSQLSLLQLRFESNMDSLNYIAECECCFSENEKVKGVLQEKIHQLDVENRALLAEVKCHQRIAQSLMQLSFFSMSMFDWRAPQWTSIVSKRMWIYWTVSIPLTLIIIVIWQLWLRIDIDHYQKSTQSNSVSSGPKTEDSSTKLSPKKVAEKMREWSRLRMRRRKPSNDEEAGTTEQAS